jgi:hypothetical protein
VPCYHPLKAYAPLSQADGGRYVFNAQKALNPDHPVNIPCGNCIGCRQDIAEDWAIRCYHESMMHSASGFVTLTYDDEHLPADFSVDLREVQLFMKKLRKAYGKGIRFFAASEYGTLNFRPHYHLLTYGVDFRSDRQLYKVTEQGPLYTSDKLATIWGKGFCTIGSATLKSAFYCLQYVFDKRGGDHAANRYVRQHPVTSEIVTCKPEFRTMSGGLGASWFHKYKASTFPSDFLVIDGRQYAVPRYYQKLLEKEAQPTTRHLPTYDLTINSNEFRDLKIQRLKRRRKDRHENNTPDRLAVRETIHQLKLNRRKTSL